MRDDKKKPLRPRTVRLRPDVKEVIKQHTGGALFQPEVAARWHVSQETVSRRLNGKTGMPIEVAEAFARELGLPLERLLPSGVAHDAHPIHGSPDPLRISESGHAGYGGAVPQPLLNQTNTLLKPPDVAQWVSGGGPGAPYLAGVVLILPVIQVSGVPGVHADDDAGEGTQMLDSGEYVAVLVDRPTVGGLRAVRVTGRCMEPTIQEGHVLIVDTENHWPQDGEVVVAVLAATQERVVRRFFRDGSSGVRLEADAEGYATRHLRGGQFQILGVVLQGTYSILRRRPAAQFNGSKPA